MGRISTSSSVQNASIVEVFPPWEIGDWEIGDERLEVVAVKNSVYVHEIWNPKVPYHMPGFCGRPKRDPYPWFLWGTQTRSISMGTSYGFSTRSVFVTRTKTSAAM